MPLSVGDELKGRYKIKETLGKGGMGSVYLAEDWLHKKDCAVKEMLDNFSDDQERQEAIRRFQNEAHILVTLEHKNIPSIIDYFIEKNCYYLVMDYVKGKNLLEIMAEKGNFSEGDVMDSGIQICNLLIYLHEHKPDPIVFRDIKPSNIMFDSEGNIMLVDFGLAKILQPKKTGTITGTPGFAAPEQYQGLAYPVSDIYSLGVTLYYLLTDRDPQENVPFNFPPISQNPSDLEKVIMKAISMKTEDRYQSAMDMKKAILLCRKTEMKMSPLKSEDYVTPSVTLDDLSKDFKPAEHHTELTLSPDKRGKKISSISSKILNVSFYFIILLILFTLLYFIGRGYYINRRVEILCDEARELYKKEDYNGTIKHYQEVINLNGDSIKAYRGLGEAYLKKKEYDKAKLSFERALDIDKDDEESHLDMAKLFLAKKDVFNAQIWYKKALVINKDNPEAINGLGDSYFILKNYKEAIGEYEKLLQLEPNSVPLRVKIGITYKKKKDYKNSMKWFSLALNIKDDYYQARLEIADIYITGRNYDKAIEEYKKILENNPDNIDATTGIGECYKRKEDYDGALKWFKKALELDNNSVKGLRGKADIYIIKNIKLDEALANLNKAIKLEPNDPLNYHTMGSYYVVKKEFSSAIKNYKKSIKLDPDIYYVHYNLGRVHAYLDHYDDAVKEYKKAINIDPLDPYVHYNLGRAYYKKENIEGAVKEYLISIKLKSDYIEPYYGLGLIYLKTGKFKEAAGYFKKVIDLDSDSELAEQARKGMKIIQFYGI
jgi:serine/threonine protein kinase/TPR repeat protein